MTDDPFRPARSYDEFLLELKTRYSAQAASRAAQARREEEKQALTNRRIIQAMRNFDD